MLYPNNTTNQIVSKEIERKIKLLEEANERNASEISSVERTVNSLGDRTSAAEDDIADIKGAVETINGEIDDINDALEEKQDKLEILDNVTEHSNNPVKSSGIYIALQGKIDTDKIKDNPEPYGTDVLSTGGAFDIVNDIGEQLGEMREAIEEAGLSTIDEAPTENSRALVRSGGIYDAIENATREVKIELNKKITANNITKPYAIKDTGNVSHYYKLWQYTGDVSELNVLHIFGVIGNGLTSNAIVDINVDINNMRAAGYVSKDVSSICNFTLSKYRASGATEDTYTLYFSSVEDISGSRMFNGYVETNLQTLYDNPSAIGIMEVYDSFVMLLSLSDILHIGNDFLSLKTDSITAHTNNGEIDVKSNIDFNLKKLRNVEEAEVSSITHQGVLQIHGVAGVNVTSQSDIVLNAAAGTRITPKEITSTTGSIQGSVNINWTDIDRGNVHTIIADVLPQTAISAGDTLSIDLEDITGIASAYQRGNYRAICYAVRKYYNASASVNIVQCLLHRDSTGWKFTFLDAIPADGDTWEITPIIISM